MRRKALLSSIALSMAALGSGCTDAGEPIFILQNQVPDEGCVISTNQNQSFLPRGIIDTQSGGGYLFNPLTQNNAVNLDSNDGARIANIFGADVQLVVQSGVYTDLETQANDESGLTRFSKRFSGTILPDGGLASFSFTIIDPAMLASLGAKLGSPDQRIEVVAEVQLFGEMAGGTIKSNTFFFPIDVCNGCMKVSVGDCAALPDGFVPLTGGECNPLQDVATECCTAADQSLVCPAAAPTTPPGG